MAMGTFWFSGYGVPKDIFTLTVVEKYFYLLLRELDFTVTVGANNNDFFH